MYGVCIQAYAIEQYSSCCIVRFLIDAQLPKSLSDWLISLGYDSLHTTELPDRNATPDHVLIKITAEQQRVVVTKDGDFLRSFLLQSLPQKLLLIRVGNISNKELLELFTRNLELMVRLLRDSDLIELHTNEVVQHR